MRRSTVLISFTLALAACGGRVSTGDGSGQAAFRPPIFVPPAGDFFVDNTEIDEQVGAQLLASKRLNLQSNVLSQLAQTGVMSADPQPTVDRECHLSVAMREFLQDLDAAHVKMNGLLVYPNCHGYHALDGSHAFPVAIPNCINSATDITNWQGWDITSFQDDKLLAAVVDLIDTLPAGHYDIGLPREPYPRGYADPLGGAASDAKYQMIRALARTSTRAGSRRSTIPRPSTSSIGTARIRSRPAPPRAPSPTTPPAILRRCRRARRRMCRAPSAATTATCSSSSTGSRTRLIARLSSPPSSGARRAA